MMYIKQLKKLLCFFSIIVFVGTWATHTHTIYACTTVASCQEEIKTATEERERLKAQINDTKSQTDALVAQVENLKIQVATYNAQIGAATQTIALLDTQSKQLQANMEQTENVLRERLVSTQLMYETNEEINFIAESDSITEMIERSQTVNELTNSDQQLVRTYDAQYNQVIENKQKTEEAKRELESYKTAQEKLIQENTVKIAEYKVAQEKLEQQENIVRDEQALSSSELQKIEDELKRIPPTPPVPVQPVVQPKQNQNVVQSQTGNTPANTPTENKVPTPQTATTKPIPTGGVYPLKHAILTAAYGESEWHTTPHNGTDYAPRGDATLYSMVDGVVVASKYNSVRGWLVAIAFNDGQGIKTLMYQHMAGAASVSIGQRVTKGQAVGVAGNSGFSFGVHLHVEVADAGPNGKWINRGGSAGPGLYATETYFGLPYSW